MPYITCPTCRRKVTFADLKEIPFRPFCSQRCRLVDLGKWLNEEYRISEPLNPAEDLPPGQPSQGSGRQES